MAGALWMLPLAAHAVLLQSLGPGGAVGPREPLEIALDLDADAAAPVASLDGIDVSHLLQVTPTGLTLLPGEALSGGSHELVVYHRDNGRLVPAGRFTFRVTGALDTRFGLYASLNAGVRVAGDDGGDDVVVDGAFGFDAEFSGEDWSGSARADFFAASGEDDVFVDDETRDVDLGDFLFKLRKGNLGARLGHHRAGPESLVLRGFNRRGASMTWEDKDTRFAATAFAFRSEPISGFEHGFGIGDSSQRVTGAVASARPATAIDTEISVTWLTGEDGGESGIGVIDDVVSGKGDAVSVAVVTRPLDEKLSIRGEFARSQFEYAEDDGRENRDDAWMLSVDSDHVFARESGNDLLLRVGVEARSVGTWFTSLANPGLPSDVESLRAHGALASGGFQLVGAVEQQENNVDDSPLLPTIRTDITSLSASYSPVAGETTPWYGQPSLGLSYNRSSQVLRDNPAALPFDLDLEMDQVTASAAFFYNAFDWRLSHTAGEIRDHTARADDSDNTLTELSFGLYGSDRWSLRSRLQRARIREPGRDRVTDQDLVDLTATAVLLPRRLNASVGVNLSDIRSSDGSLEEEVRVIDLGLNYTLREPARSRAGISLWLRGEHRDVSGSGERFFDDDDYRVFLGVSVDYAK